MQTAPNGSHACVGGGLLKLAIQIAAGIIIASAVIGIGRHFYLRAQLEAAGRAFQQMQADMERQNAERRARMQAEQRERQRLQEAAKQAQLEADAARMRADAEAARAEQEAAARKAAAWAAFYRPAKKCDNPSDWDTQVECGNAHIRAQREFEARWARGEL